MSLNCLTSQVLRRTDSNNYRDCGNKQNDSSKFCCMMIDRSLSMNISPAGYEQIRSSTDQPIPVVPSKKMNKGHHRRIKTIATTYGAVRFEGDVDGEPRLVRSCAMRRDWSFEDLRAQRDEKLRKEMTVS
ncbi:hypothetical protein PTKIN_Ptkin05aG0012100 [Pterospermum kingtungense]